MNRKKEFVLTIGFIVILLTSVGLAAILMNPEVIPPNTVPNNQTTPTSSPGDTASPTPEPSAVATVSPAPTMAPSKTATSTPSPTQVPTPIPTASPIPSPSPYPTPNPASVVFSDSFESGNMSAWTNTDVSGVNVAVKNSMLECSTNTFTSGHWGYVYKWLNETYQALNWRWYLFFSNLPTTDGNVIGGGGMYNSAIEGNFTAANGVCALSVVRQDGDWYWSLSYVDSDAVYSINSTSTVSTDTWYLVELKAVRGAGDGEVHFYLNNAEALNATGLTNIHNAGIDHVSIGGGITADQPVTWYCTHAIASTEYIGPKSELALTNQAADINNFSLSSLALFSIAIVGLAVSPKLMKMARRAEQNGFKEWQPAS